MTPVGRGGRSDSEAGAILRLNRQLEKLEGDVARIRQQRNALVRAAYATGRFSYGSLAAATGMTKEAVAAICSGRL